MMSLKARRPWLKLAEAGDVSGWVLGRSGRGSLVLEEDVASNAGTGISLHLGANPANSFKAVTQKACQGPRTDGVGPAWLGVCRPRPA